MAKVIDRVTVSCDHAATWSLFQVAPFPSFSFLSHEEEEYFCLENIRVLFYFIFPLLACFLDRGSIGRERVSALLPELEFRPFLALVGFLDSSCRLPFQLPGLQCLLGYFVCQIKP